MNFFRFDAPDASQFQGPVVSGGENGAPKIVLYYVPWCPHCKDVMPEWNKLEQNMQGTQTEVKKVDCEANPQAAKEQDVNGFPTIILFKNGKAIQPLSLVHGNYYSDYSHGIRLVSNTIEINGEAHPIEIVLKDPSLAKIISYEGPVRFTRYRTEEDFIR